MIALAPPARATLLRLARVAIEDALHGDGRLARLLARTALPPELEQPRAVFVTLTSCAEKREVEALRGCIGSLDATRSLVRSVIEVAPKTALEDPRFPPLAADELERVRIAISVLGPLEPLDRIEDLVVGRHGVRLECGAARSVFLPQVAPEQGWSRQDLMRELSRKAGLADDGWTRARLGVFETESFSEEECTG